MHEHNVQESRRSSRSASFGPFEICLKTGELLKYGVRVRLQGKPFQILSALLEEPGAVVTREELRARLWSNDTYVDFESGLNTAANRLRAALSDSAETPIYIETLSRVGYRFIAPVAFSDKLHPNGNEANSSVTQIVEQPPRPEPVRTRHRFPALSRRAWIGVVGMAAAFAVAVLAFIRFGPVSRSPQFRQLTFATGKIATARFSRDGKQLFYAAAWNGRPSHLFALDIGTGETKDLGFEGRTIAGVSPSGELALYSEERGTKRLDIFTAQGGRETNIPGRAVAVDWSPRGEEWFIVRHGADRAIEHPRGHLIYVTNSFLDDLRVSPDGTQVAFLRHLLPMDDGGDVVVVKAGGEARVLSRNWDSVRGLAWSRSGRELWFTAAAKGVNRQLMSVSLDGRLRQIADVPGGIVLHDVSSSGDVLITRDTTQISMLLGDLKTGKMRDVSWLDWAVARASSPDGRLLLFDETGDGGGKRYSTYVYDDSTGTHRRIGSGWALDLSADGQFALTQLAGTQADLNLVSVNGGSSRPIAAANFVYKWARFVRTNPLEIVALGGYAQEEEGIFTQRIPDGRPVRVSAQILSSIVVSPNGRFVAGNSLDGSICVIDLTNGSARLLPDPDHAMPAAFTSDNEIALWHPERGSVAVDIFDRETGTARPFAKVNTDSALVPDIFEFTIARNLSTYSLSGEKLMSTLFSVTGWK